MIRTDDGRTFEPTLTEAQRLEVFSDHTSARYLSNHECVAALMWVESNVPEVFDAAVVAMERRRQRRGETREAP